MISQCAYDQTIRGVVTEAPSPHDVGRRNVRAYLGRVHAQPDTRPLARLDEQLQLRNDSAGLEWLCRLDCTKEGLNIPHIRYPTCLAVVTTDSDAADGLRGDTV
jgi:hypothetical protein